MQKIVSQRSDNELAVAGTLVNKVDSSSAQMVFPARKPQEFEKSLGGSRKHATFGALLPLDTKNARDESLSLVRGPASNDISPLPTTHQNSEVYATSGNDNSARLGALSFGKSSNQPSVSGAGSSDLNFIGQLSTITKPSLL